MLLSNFLLVLASLGRKWPLLGQNWYKYCLNTLDPSLTHIISQMLWIVTNIDHRNTNKAIYCFKAMFCWFLASFGTKWVYMLSKHSYSISNSYN
ncbi:hypothetical protein AtNW77_Chr1g0042091 [Arabidopsis thaliana]